MLTATLCPLTQAAGHMATRLFNRLDPPVVVLLYHRVADLDHDPDMLAVSPARFREQLLWLRSSYPITRFEAEWSDVEQPTFVITFDDGYSDNFHAALPILEELEVPATFFVTSGQLDSKEEFWWDELARHFRTGTCRPHSLHLPLEEIEERFPTASEAECRETYAYLHRLLLGSPVELRRKVMTAVRQWANDDGAGRESHRALSTAELIRLADSPWATIGAHTVSHPRLSILDPERQRLEIAESKAAIEAKIGRRLDVFAYPFGGRRDYSRQTPDICRELGFSKAASNFSGNSYRWTNPFQVPRHLVRDWNSEEFAWRITRYVAR